ncbi:MAG: cell division protein SepF [Actinomycetes bacterium]
MPGWMRKTMDYLGLSDGDEVDQPYEAYIDDLDGSYTDEVEDEPEPVIAPPRRERMVRPAAAPSGTVRTVDASTPPTVATPVVDATKPIIRPVAASSARVHVVEPRGFNDAQEVGDRLKAGQPVIINLQGIDNDLKRRLIDFSSGLTYAISGTMSRVSDQVFLLTPSNTEVSDEEKERLQARGLYRP